MILDSAISPIDRIKLTAELTQKIAELNGSISPLDRINTAKRVSEIVAVLGGGDIPVGVSESDGDDLSDDPNSPNYRYRDTGYIADSRKEKAASMIFVAKKNGQRVRSTDIDWTVIEKNPRQAAELVTKANLFGKSDWQAMQDKGMEPGAGFLIDKIYASIGKEPAESPVHKGMYLKDANELMTALQDTPLGRRDYAIGLETIRDRLEDKLTVLDVMAVIEEIRGELGGCQLDSSEAEAYELLKEQIVALHAEQEILNKSSDEVYAEAQKAKSEVYSIESDIRGRKKRGWAVAEQESDLAAAEKHHEGLWARFSEIRGDVNPKLEVIREKISDLNKQLSAIKAAARRRNLMQNQATRSWLTFGERFFKLVNYRNYTKGSDSFAGHVTNAKVGKIKDWSWSDKERGHKPKDATREEINFQIKVTDTFERKGGKEIHVNGTKALEEMIGFRAVQSGNWVLDDVNSAKFHVESTAAAMSDLSDLLGVDAHLLGIGGRLGMSFGARGTGGKGAPRAHYEPVLRVINITKMGGGGCLAHEWLHAVDNILHELVNQEASGKKNDFVTTNPALLPAGAIQDAVMDLRNAMLTGEHRLSETITYTEADIKTAHYNIDTPRNAPAKAISAAGNAVDAVKAVDDIFAGRTDKRGLKTKNGWRKLAVAFYHKEGTEMLGEKYAVRMRVGAPVSSFAYEASLLDNGEMNKYWSQTEELAARGFQSYIEDTLASQDRRNDYLSAMADNKYYVDPILGLDQKPFPEGEERARINAAFGKLFEVLKNEKVFEKAVANKPLMDAIFGELQVTDSAEGDKVLEQLLKDFEVSDSPIKRVMAAGKVADQLRTDGGNQQNFSEGLGRKKAYIQPPKMIHDNPGGQWLKDEIEDSQTGGRTPVGAPRRFGALTMAIKTPVWLPVDRIAKVRGLRDEQNNVRPDSLNYLKSEMAKTGRFPLMDDSDDEYAPFIMVDFEGRPWVNEGNHRIMAAKELGWKYAPVEVRYFAGGEQISGEWSPESLMALHEVAAKQV